VTIEPRLEVLGRTTWLRSATPEHLRELARLSSSDYLERDQTLFLEGDTVQHVMVLCTGFARTHRSSAHRDLTVATHGTGAALGVTAAFLEPPLHAFSAQMLAAGTALRLDAVGVRALVGSDANFAALTLRHVARQHAQLTQRLSELNFTDLEARLASLLLETCSPSGWQLPTNALLAAQLGTVPELVSRKLGEFYRRGWIRLERRRVWVVNLEVMCARCEGPASSSQ
jgi:CRP/FNR family transcriptional regulator